MFHCTTVVDAGLSQGYGKEIQLALDPLARLFMYESHRRRRRICRLLERLSLALSRRCSASFLHRRVFYTFIRSHARVQKITQHSLTGIRDASFGRPFFIHTLACHDVYVLLVKP